MNEASFLKDRDAFLASISEDLSAWIQPVFYEEGEQIHDSLASDTLIYLYRGKLKILVYDAAGKEFLTFVESPRFIGDTDFLELPSMQQKIYAVSDCEGFMIHTGDCRSLLLHDARFMQFLAESIAAVSRCRLEKELTQRTYPLKNRLAAFILQWSDEEGVFSLPITETARCMGAAYPYVHSVLTKLENAGMICRNASGLKITDRDKLEALRPAAF